MKKIVTLSLIIMIVLLGMSLVVEAQNKEKMYSRAGFFERIRNRFRDMMGICKEDDLTVLEGTLGHGARFFQINDTELHFGPNWYIHNTVSSYDYDRDGTNETIIQEIEGLTSTEISVEGCLHSEKWISVYKINGISYREPGQPIWNN